MSWAKEELKVNSWKGCCGVHSELTSGGIRLNGSSEFTEDSLTVTHREESVVHGLAVAPQQRLQEMLTISQSLSQGAASREEE